MAQKFPSFNLFTEDIQLEKDDNNIKNIVKKIEDKPSTEQIENVEKLLKSSKLTLFERLNIIKERVLTILGKQKNNVLVIKTKEDLHNYISDCIKAGRIDIDTETNNTTDAVTCKLMGPCFYAPGLKQAYVPLNHIDPETDERLPWQLTEADIKEELQRILDTNTFIIMHNGKFDYEVLKCTCGVEVAPNWDTIIAARLIDENLYSDKRTSLKYLYTTLIDPTQAKYDIESLFENIPYAYVEPDIFALYAATDSMMTDKLYLWEKPKFEGEENRKLKWLFETIEMPIVQVTAELELTGVAVDEELGERLKVKYNDQLLANLDAKIDEYLDEIKPLIDNWKLSKWANRPAKIYASAKSKMALNKLEATYPYTDSDGRRYKLGKAMVSLLDDKINLASPVQLQVLFYDILFRPAPSSKNPRGTGEDEMIALDEKLKESLVTVDSLADSATRKFLANEAEAEADSLKTIQENKSAQVASLFADIPLYAPETPKLASKEVLTELYKKAFIAAQKLCSAIIERRGIVKLISTYIDVIPELAKHWPDGRIRFKMNSMGTDTGRYSSGGKWHWLDENNNSVTVSGINIQNIPSHNKEIRMLFKAETNENTISTDNNTFIVPEITEVETPSGFKYCNELNVGDILIVDNENIAIKNIVYNTENKTYSIYINEEVMPIYE